MVCFKYSRNSFRESVHKQAERGSSAEDFGKMLTVLPEVCAGAVEIESHTDKYDGTKRMDPNIKEVHVLLGAFADGDYVIPVQLEIKEYKPGAGLDNKLYMTVTLKKAEAGILLRAPINASAQSGIRNTPARRNPYDGKVGQQVIDAREKAKENADSGAGMNATEDDESFQQAFLNQLLGRG